MAVNLTNYCSGIQKSLDWCQGTPEMPGIRRRIYYIAKGDILAWPALPRDSKGRATSAILQGSFTLRADAHFKYIEIIADKSQLTSEPQGEYPSQTQLNKLVAVHPGVGPEATAACAYINNTDCVFVVVDMKGHYRVVGSENWLTKSTVNQDLGQGPSGTTSTTVNVEASDEVAAPFYTGTLDTEDGEIDCAGDVAASDS